LPVPETKPPVKPEDAPTAAPGRNPIALSELATPKLKWPAPETNPPIPVPMAPAAKPTLNNQSL